MPKTPTRENVTFTHHAIEGMVEAGIQPAEVYEVLLAPQIVEEDRTGRYRYVRDDMVVVTFDDRRIEGGVVVKTVLWRKPERWTRVEWKAEREAH